MDEPEERHWTDSYDASYSDKDRTLSLVDNTSINYNRFKNKDNIFAMLEQNLETYANGVTIDTLFNYLRKHPDMLKFSFDNEGKISEIKVKRDTRLTFFNDSVKRLCDMSYYISEMLKILILNSDTDWQPKDKVKVVMDESNQTYCIHKGHSNPIPPPSDNSVAAGGSKSQRRHRRRVRKTRRGRIRKSMSKTHRRKRHSRIRKHKKNTSRRK